MYLPVGYPDTSRCAREKAFGTHGRLAIPFVHLFIIMGPYLILKKLLLLFTGVVQDIISLSLCFLFLFFFSEDFDERTSERERHPRVLFLYLLSTISERKIEGL